MNEEECNDWPNYETLVAARWLEIDMDDFCKEQAAECWRLAGTEKQTSVISLERSDQAAALLAERLKDHVEDSFPSQGFPCPIDSLADDLLWSAFWEIDWLAIAQQLIDDLVSQENEPNDN